MDNRWFSAARFEEAGHLTPNRWTSTNLICLITSDVWGCWNCQGFFIYGGKTYHYGAFVIKTEQCGYSEFFVIHYSIRLHETGSYWSVNLILDSIIWYHVESFKDFRKFVLPDLFPNHCFKNPIVTSPYSKMNILKLSQEKNSLWIMNGWQNNYCLRNVLKLVMFQTQQPFWGNLYFWISYKLSKWSSQYA